MNVQIMSDLHLEFHEDMGLEFVKRLNTDGVDLVVVAGDNHVSGGIGISLELLAAAYPRVLYVPGNHDFYDSNLIDVSKMLSALQRNVPNIDILCDDVVEIDGCKFAGTTLWFDWTYECNLLQSMIADTGAIKDFELSVRAEHRRARVFLEQEVDAETIVITHHLPAPQSVAPFFKNSRTNCFFLCDMSALIAERQPRLWIHGHTHESCDYRLGDTRVVCNPRGYQGHRINRRFDPKLIVELP